MKPSIQDTIYAPATSLGGALVLVRLSGPCAIAALQSFFRGKRLADQPSHTVHIGMLHYGDEVIDEVMASVFREGNSFTGEEMVEISCHGSPYILRRTLQLFSEHPSCRLAREGEFSQRAFLHGKLGLTQAEAVGELISAQSAVQHDIAIRQLKGSVAKRIGVMRNQLIDCASLLELEVDFSEEDVEFANRDQLKRMADSVKNQLGTLLESFDRGRAIKEGIAVAIVGKPNAGKSTLFNSLIEEEKAIVSDIAGTTRDYLEDVIVLDGLLLRFVDTAGLRSTEDDVEKQGVERSKQKIASADMVLYVFDAHTINLEEYEEVKAEYACMAKAILWIGNKSDLPASSFILPEEVIKISALKESGLSKLKQRLVQSFQQSDSTVGAIVNQRHADCLSRALQEINALQEGLLSGKTPDLLALHLRYATQAIGEITGEIYSDDILGNIFSKFCIGK